VSSLALPPPNRKKESQRQKTPQSVEFPETKHIHSDGLSASSMSKLKNLLPTIFGGKEAAQNPTATEGRLEKDAAPVDDSEPDNNNSGALALPSSTGTPTASADLTESVLRELSDPNYNSMDMVQSANIPGTLSNAQTNNTMNVHSAQQQVVMNFSNASTARAPSNRTNMLIYARTHICTGFYGPSASVCVCAVDVAAFCGCVCERECAARVYYQPLKNTLFFAERTEF